MILENLPFLTGLRVADVGTGTGVIAIVVAMRGAKEVIATDISDLAVKNAIKNSEMNGVSDRVKIIKTDLLDNVEGLFDIICANLPILEDVWIERGIKVDSTIKRFLVRAKLKLNKGGNIYIPWASFAEKDRGGLEFLFLEYGYKFDFKSADALGYTWYLYILKI